MFMRARKVGRLLAAGSLLLCFSSKSDLAMAESRDLTLEAPASGAARPRPNKQTSPMRISLVPIGPSVVTIGSRVAARVQANNAGFGHLYVVNASGKVVLLAENLPLRANRAVILPKEGMVLRATPPTGDNVLHFLATRTRFPGFAGGATTTVPIDIQISGPELEAQIATRLSQTPRNQWGLTRTVIRVVE